MPIGECSNEVNFWSMADEAKNKGISRSLMGKLASSVNDYGRSVSILRTCLTKKNPSSYLYKTISNIKNESDVAGLVNYEPNFVVQARMLGMTVRQVRTGWWVGGTVYNSRGEAIGW